MTSPRRAALLLPFLLLPACLSDLDFDSIEPSCEAPRFDVTTYDQYCSGFPETLEPITLPEGPFGYPIYLGSDASKTFLAYGKPLVLSEGLTSDTDPLPLFTEVELQLFDTPNASALSDAAPLKLTVGADDASANGSIYAITEIIRPFDELNLLAVNARTTLALVDMDAGTTVLLSNKRRLPLLFTATPKPDDDGVIFSDLVVFEGRSSNRRVIAVGTEQGLKLVYLEKAGNSWFEDIPTLTYAQFDALNSGLKLTSCYFNCNSECTYKRAGTYKWGTLFFEKLQAELAPDLDLQALEVCLEASDCNTRSCEESKEVCDVELDKVVDLDDFKCIFQCFEDICRTNIERCAEVSELTVADPLISSINEYCNSENKCDTNKAQCDSEFTSCVTTGQCNPEFTKCTESCPEACDDCGERLVTTLPPGAQTLALHPSLDLLYICGNGFCAAIQRSTLDAWSTPNAADQIADAWDVSNKILLPINSDDTEQTVAYSPVRSVFLDNHLYIIATRFLGLSDDNTPPSPPFEAFLLILELDAATGAFKPNITQLKLPSTEESAVSFELAVTGQHQLTAVVHKVSLASITVADVPPEDPLPYFRDAESFAIDVTDPARPIVRYSLFSEGGLPNQLGIAAQPDGGAYIPSGAGAVGSRVVIEGNPLP